MDGVYGRDKCSANYGAKASIKGGSNVESKGGAYGSVTVVLMVVLKVACNRATIVLQY